MAATVYLIVAILSFMNSGIDMISFLLETDIPRIRVLERIGIAVIFFSLAIFCFIVLIRKVQIVDAKLQWFALTVTLSTPIFVLISVIVFAWVSYSNPISIRAPSSSSETAAPSTSDTASDLRVYDFVGLGGAGDLLDQNIGLAFENYSISHQPARVTFSSDEARRMTRIGLKLHAIHKVKPFDPGITNTPDGFDKWESTINAEFNRLFNDNN